VIFVDLIFPGTIATLTDFAKSTSATILVILVFLFGLLCYFLGTIFNGVSNKVIRVWMSNYRRAMISRKLGLPSKGSFTDLQNNQKTVINRFLPKLKSKNPGDKLNELYAVAKTYSAISSELSRSLIDYHWALVRLSRATLLPLLLLTIVLFIRAFIPQISLIYLFAFSSCCLLFFLTFINYRYREKF